MTDDTTVDDTTEENTVDVASHAAGWLAKAECDLHHDITALLMEPRHGTPAQRASYAVDMIRLFVADTAHIADAATVDGQP